jgi:hypothetical protein
MCTGDDVVLKLANSELEQSLSVKYWCPVYDMSGSFPVKLITGEKTASFYVGSSMYFLNSRRFKFDQNGWETDHSSASATFLYMLYRIQSNSSLVRFAIRSILQVKEAS